MTVHDLEIDGGTLAVEIKGDGPLIVCSPGMGDTRDAYAAFADQLVSKGYKVATIDPRGHGDSSTTFKHYGDEATADDFIAVINKFGKGPAVLAGASYSSAAAVVAAAKQPSLVAGIILLGPFLRNPSAIGLLIMPILFFRPWGPYFWRYYAKTLWPGLGEDKAKARAASSTASLTRPGRWSAFQRLVGSLDHNKAVDPWIKKVKASVLVVMGDKDPDWSDPVKEADWVATQFDKVEKTIVPGAGHAPQYESPDLVSADALKFLSKLRSEGALK